MKASEHFEHLRRTDIDFAYESYKQERAENEILRDALIDICAMLKPYRQVIGWDALTTAEQDCVSVYQRATKAFDAIEEAIRGK